MQFQDSPFNPPADFNQLIHRHRTYTDYGSAQNALKRTQP